MIFGKHTSPEVKPSEKESDLSANPVRRANLAAITCDPRPQLPDGFRRHSARVGALLGAARAGARRLRATCRVRRLAQYHYEDPEEEWLLVVSGAPTFGTPAGMTSSNRGTSSSFPPGPAGAHLVRNDSESTARVAMFSSITAVGAVVYPDSDMIQIFTTEGDDDVVVKRSSAVDVAARGANGPREGGTET